MKDFLIAAFKKNFFSILIFGLLLIIAFQRIGKINTVLDKPTVVITRDTVYYTKDSTIHLKPTLVSYQLPDSILRGKDTVYMPSKELGELTAQYRKLLQDYLTENRYKDSVKVDSLGTIYIADTVSRNSLAKQAITYDFKIPHVKETITITNPPLKTRQMYIGGGVNGTSIQPISGFEGGLLYKNKKDQIFGAKVNINTGGQISYGLQSYWKIKL